jgi:hypothetical protein
VPENERSHKLAPANVAGSMASTLTSVSPVPVSIQALR